MLTDPGEEHAMDGTRFDQMTRSLAAFQTRRSFLKGCAALLTTGAAGARQVTLAATCTPPGPLNYCNADSECCGHADCILGICQCEAGYKQCGSLCVPISQNCGSCPAGWQRCNGGCLNVQNDRFNCGSCGRQCSANQICSVGHCCPKGLNWCNGQCIQGLCS
jgi:hypothetical protein